MALVEISCQDGLQQHRIRIRRICLGNVPGLVLDQDVLEEDGHFVVILVFCKLFKVQDVYALDLGLGLPKSAVRAGSLWLQYLKRDLVLQHDIVVLQQVVLGTQILHRVLSGDFKPA